MTLKPVLVCKMGTMANRARIKDPDKFKSDSAHANDLKMKTCNAVYVRLSSRGVDPLKNVDKSLPFSDKIRARCECKVEMLDIDEDVAFAPFVDVASVNRRTR